jgi:hypothetical protein
LSSNRADNIQFWRGLSIWDIFCIYRSNCSDRIIAFFLQRDDFRDIIIDWLLSRFGWLIRNRLITPFSTPRFRSYSYSECTFRGTYALGPPSTFSVPPYSLPQWIARTVTLSPSHTKTSEHVPSCEAGTWQVTPILTQYEQTGRSNNYWPHPYFPRYLPDTSGEKS